MDHPTLIVTGASRGMGAAAARAAVHWGANVVLNARSPEQLLQTAQKLTEAGGRVLSVPGDVSREEHCQALIQQALDHFGRIDALVNNAGTIEPIGPVAQTSRPEWERNWAVNLLGPVLLAQLALPQLRQRNGRIVNITSGAAIGIIPGWGAYSVSKAALNHFTRVLAAEEPAVTAVALRPGIMDTQMQVTIREKGKSRMAESNYKRLSGLYEQGQLLPPDAPGRAIACLALFAPPEWSGEVLEWDEPRVQELVRAHSLPNHSPGRDGAPA